MMQTIGDAVLYCADCLPIMQSMQDESVEMIFADPPFNVGKEYKGDIDDEMPEGEYHEWLGVRLVHMSRILKRGRTFWLMESQRHIGWCQTALTGLGLTFQNIIAWAYTNPTPKAHGLAHTWRPILLVSKGDMASFDPKADSMTHETLYHNPYRAKTHYPHDLWPDIPKLVGGFLSPPELLRDEDGRFVHLAQMPLRIAQRAILMATKPGDTVFDPFMGVATVGLAALLEKRKYIGIDKSNYYYGAAVRRLERWLQHVPLPL